MRHLLNMLKILGASLLDFVYPPYCSLCKRRLQEGEKIICEDCWGKIVIIDGPHCIRCGRPLEAGAVNCPCQKENRSFQHVRVLTPFDETARQIIHLLKYKKKRSLGRRLGEMLARILVEEPEWERADLIIPVPLHKSRLRERGYNQSSLIALSIGEKLRKPVRENLLIRKRRTCSQTELDATERVENVAGAFGVPHPEEVSGKRIILADDLITTGATADACSRALLDAGAEDVLVAAVASPF